MVVKKTDNHNVAAKLRLRRHFLDRYHSGTFSVLDCCEGNGTLWDLLAGHYEFWKWGVDVKPAPGRLACDSRRILEAVVDFDVVDIDTYGSPWSHWLALLGHVKRPTTVFLTEGMLTIGGGNVQGAVKVAAGLSFRTMEPPGSLVVKYVDKLAAMMLARAAAHALTIREAVEALNPNGSARYFGVRLEPTATVAARGTEESGIV